MKQVIIFALAAFAMWGCDSSVTDFVKGGDILQDIGNLTPVIPLAAPVGIKVSPGHVVSSSGGITMEATVTPTNRMLKSADNTMSMEVTVGRGAAVQ